MTVRAEGRSVNIFPGCSMDSFACNQKINWLVRIVLLSWLIALGVFVNVSVLDSTR